MFHAQQRLPHLLPPSSYSSEQQFLLEQERVFSRSWHFVGLTTDLARHGDFITTEICGNPIQIRNVNDKLCAYSNVCLHRHCLLTSCRKGTSPKLRCQYHGWEYDAKGMTARIPQAQHFAPLDRGSTGLDVFPCETVGSLVFINLDANAASLQSFLGNSWDSIRNGFGTGWEKIVVREFALDVNWKIPIENSLEAYHVPAIHPETFRSDPGEDRAKHVLGDRGSAYHTTLPFAEHSKTDAWFQNMEGHVMRTLIGNSPTATYQQHHVFPNLLFSFTDMISLIHVVQPIGPQSCVSRVCQFGRVGKSYLARSLSRLWGSLAASVTLKVLKEDFQLLPDIQRGLNASRNAGMLGRCEERIHLFQQWIENELGGSNPIDGRPQVNRCVLTNGATTNLTTSKTQIEMPPTQ